MAPSRIAKAGRGWGNAQALAPLKTVTSFNDALENIRQQRVRGKGQRVCVQFLASENSALLYEPLKNDTAKLDISETY